jgi:DNA-directed RNA polymerase subunit beta
VENRYLFKDIYDTVDGERKRILRAGDQLHAHEIDELIQRQITSVELVDMDNADTLHSDIVLNCFKEEDAKYTSEGLDEPSKEDVLTPIFTVLMPGEMVAVDRAEKDLPDMFFSPRKYDLAPSAGTSSTRSSAARMIPRTSPRCSRRTSSTRWPI